MREPDTRIDAVTGATRSADALMRRERYFFDLYRGLEATALAALCLSEAGERIAVLVSPTHARVGALVYLIGALSLFAFGRFARGDGRLLVLLGLLLDTIAAVTAIFATNGFDQQIAAMLLVNVTCGALLLPPRVAFFFAAIASASVVSAFGLATRTPETWTEGLLFALGYVAATVLGQLMRRYVAETSELAEQRESALANLTQLNDLIIRRMRTGVIVVDETNVIRRINESAWHLLGNPPPSRTVLADAAPELSRRLFQWRQNRKHDSLPVSLAEGMPEVIPRFANLAQGDEGTVLIFLDDISLLSRQAEQLTLSSLGRLSASVAHEVRNPLAAISYSAQLLSESEELPEPDKRLVDIIRAQCTRMNAIVENILQISRRERSRPESIDVGRWVAAFADEYATVHPLESDELKTAVQTPRGASVMVDPEHLQQIVWNLVQNALRYGRTPGQAARVTIASRVPPDASGPVIEISDRGPGIPAKLSERVFEPFFTTHEHGTGLGLYIARQLCEANQGALEYVPVAGGGSCFRITLPVAGRPMPAGGAARRANNGFG